MPFGAIDYTSSNGYWAASEVIPKKPSKKKTAAGAAGYQVTEDDITVTRASDRDNKTGERVARACIFCRSSKLKCDHQRPCSRCIHAKRAHLCVDAPPLRRPGNNMPMTRPIVQVRPNGRVRTEARRRRDASDDDDDDLASQQIYGNLRGHLPSYPSKRSRRAAYSMDPSAYNTYSTQADGETYQSYDNATFVNYSDQTSYQYGSTPTANDLQAHHDAPHACGGGDCAHHHGEESHDHHDYEDELSFLNIDPQMLASYTSEQQQLFLRQLSDHAATVYGRNMSPADIYAYIQALAQARSEASAEAVSHTPTSSPALQGHPSPQQYPQAADAPPTPTATSIAAAVASISQPRKDNNAPSPPGYTPLSQLLQVHLPYRPNSLRVSVPGKTDVLLPSALKDARLDPWHGVNSRLPINNFPSSLSLACRSLSLHPTAISGPCSVDPTPVPPPSTGSSLTYGLGSTASLSILLSQASACPTHDDTTPRSFSAPCFTGFGGLFSTFTSPAPRASLLNTPVAAAPSPAARQAVYRIAELTAAQRAATDANNTKLAMDILSDVVAELPDTIDLAGPTRNRAPCGESRRLMEHILTVAEQIIPDGLPAHIRMRILHSQLLRHCDTLGLPDDVLQLVHDALQALPTAASSEDMRAVVQVGPMPTVAENLRAAVAQCVAESCQEAAALMDVAQARRMFASNPEGSPSPSIATPPLSGVPSADNSAVFPATFSPQRSAPTVLNVDAAHLSSLLAASTRNMSPPVLNTVSSVPSQSESPASSNRDIPTPPFEQFKADMSVPVSPALSIAANLCAAALARTAPESYSFPEMSKLLPTPIYNHHHSYHA